MSDPLFAALQLSEHPDVCSALMQGLPVPRDRLRPGMLAAIDEPATGADFVLTDEAVLRVEVCLNGAGPALVTEPADSWLIDAADLLAEPDPGPTPWLVDELIVDRALVAAVGPWKATKSYGLLEIAIAVRTGRPAFGRFEIAQPGPVVFVIEESGRDALWRRLDSLSRGRAIPREELRGLKLAANAGVKLDDPDWQKRLIDVGQFIRPRLFIFDPLARLKAAGRDENAQTDMAALIEFIRSLRDETEAAVTFVQHTGHQGGHMRGSSDLESVWETRLSWKKNGGTVELTNEHRDAESGPKLEYRLNWDHDTRTMRLESEDSDAPDDETLQRVKEHLDKHPDDSANDVFRAVGGSRPRVLKAVKTVHAGGTGYQRVPHVRQPGSSGTPGAPLKGPGYHLEQPVPEPPVDEEEIERLAELARETQQ